MTSKKKPEEANLILDNWYKENEAAYKKLIDDLDPTTLEYFKKYEKAKKRLSPELKALGAALKKLEKKAEKLGIPVSSEVSPMRYQYRGNVYTPKGAVKQNPNVDFTQLAKLDDIFYDLNEWSEGLWTHSNICYG